MLAEIITIGDEILIGQIVDTNSAWIAQQLNAIGFKVNQIISISDDAAQITDTLKGSFERANLILITGGIGPTRDDITKQTLASFFNTPLELNPIVLHDIENLLKQRNAALNELNRKQAEIPVGCRVIRNTCGTAAGMWFELNGKVLVSMPGVPFEMKMMMENDALPAIKKHFNTPVIYHKTILIHGIAESDLAMVISDWETALPSFMKLAYLPSPGIIRLRISSTGNNKEKLENSVEEHLVFLRSKLGEKIFAEDDLSVETVIGNLLLTNKKSIAVAESCTGGNIAHLLTLVPGSSAYFKGGMVVYSNDIKQSILDVSEASLNCFGAVSKQVVEEMAENIARKFGTDYGIGISGIAGPGGGTAEKPVGTVWIAVFNGRETASAMFLFGDNRERNIARASISALNMLRLQIQRDVQLV